MKVALVGASGNAGSRILAELARRGHQVTAIARNPERIVAGAHIRAVKGDADNAEALAKLVAGHDALVSAIHFTASDPHKLIAAAKASGVSRYIVVGGAGSLEVAPGARLVDQPDFPAPYKQEALAGGDFLALLKAEPALNWTFLSPAALFTAGERTGKFRLGADQLLTTVDGKSWISFEDYAVALVDELEKPAHERKRFTVGY